MRKIKITITKEMKEELNEVRKTCGFEPTNTEPEELECLFG